MTNKPDKFKELTEPPVYPNAPVQSSKTNAQLTTLQVTPLLENVSSRINPQAPNIVYLYAQVWLLVHAQLVLPVNLSRDKVSVFTPNQNYPMNKKWMLFLRPKYPNTLLLLLKHSRSNLRESTKPRKNMNSDSEYSTRTLNLSRTSTEAVTTHTISESMNSLTFHTKNSQLNTVVLHPDQKENSTLSTLILPILQIVSIGELKVLSPPLRTKNNAVPAGLSLLLQQWRVFTSRHQALLRASLSSNLLTALLLRVTWVAKVV